MSMTVLAASVSLCVIVVVLIRSISHFYFRNKFPISLKKRMLSVDEHNFLKCLERAIGDEYYIFTKVRLLEIINNTPQTSGLLNRRKINQTLQNVCVDYVLCDKRDMSILGIIELEKFDKLTRLKDKVYREKLLSSVARAADVRLFYFDGRQDYSGMDLRRLITGRNDKQKSVTPDPSMVSVEENSSLEVGTIEKVRSCPKCYSDVVIKMAVKGDRIGEKFLMCRKYPYCDYQVSVKDDSIKKMQTQEENRRSSAGYRNW